MNLYRSFGNLLEIWVTDGVPFSDLDAENWRGSDHSSSVESPGSAPDMEINLRSESDDSGVEMTGSHTSLSSPCRPLPGAEPVLTGREEERALTPGSPPSPPLSSSLVSVCPLEPRVPSEGSSIDLHRRVEQALVRATPGRQGTRTDSKPGVGEEVPTGPSHKTKCGRSENFISRRPVSNQRPEQCRRPLSLYHDKSQTQSKKEERSAKARDRLSPGLSYLEQVCRMLEEIARLQRRNHGLQAEMDVLREHQTKQPPESRLCDCKAAAEDVSFSERLGTASSTGNLRCSSLDFRRRSASDTRVLATTSLRTMLPHTRGQHLNENVLAEQTEEKDEMQEPQEEKKSKRWSLKKGSSSQREGMSNNWDSKKNSQQTHPSEKKTAGHRLSQLFRGRGKTLPA